MKTVRYVAYDLFEEAEVLGTYDTIEEARASCREREEDTDGECYTRIHEVGVDDAKKIIFIRDIEN